MKMSASGKKIFQKKLDLPPNPPNPFPDNQSSNQPSKDLMSKDFVADLNANKFPDPKKTEEDEQKEDDEAKKMLDNPVLIMRRSDFFSPVDRETEQMKYLVFFHCQILF